MHRKLPHQEEGFGSGNNTVSLHNGSEVHTTKQVDESGTLQAAHESSHGVESSLDSQEKIVEEQSVLQASETILGGAKGGARSEHFNRGASAAHAQEPSDDSIDVTAVSCGIAPPIELSAGSFELPAYDRKKSSGLSLFATGFLGPVPLSTLGSPFQEFVLQKIASEVLKEVRYVAASATAPQSGKMSAAKQVAVSFDDVREKNLKQLRKLNQVLFPVRYEEKFYTDVLWSGEYTKLGER